MTVAVVVTAGMNVLTMSSVLTIVCPGADEIVVAVCTIVVVTNDGQLPCLLGGDAQAHL